MKKIVIAIFALAAFLLSSVTAFAASDKVERYSGAYTAIAANWVSYADGITSSSWINIQSEGEKGEDLFYGTEYMTSEGEYLGYREFYATLPEGTINAEKRNLESFHLILSDVSGTEVFWSPDSDKEEQPEPQEVTHSFEIDLVITETYKEMFLAHSRFFDIKFRDFSRGLTYAARSTGSVDGEGFEGDGNISFSSYSGMAIGEQVPEEPKVLSELKEKPGNDVQITKDSQIQLYTGFEEIDPDAMETLSYTELGISRVEKGTFSVSYFSMKMEGSIANVRFFDGQIPESEVGIPKKLEGSITADFTAQGLWYEFVWDTESEEDPVVPDPSEGSLDAAVTWYLEEGRTFRAISKYSSGTFTRMNHEAVDTSSAWTEGTIDGEVFTDGFGDISIGRFMSRIKGELPWDK